jgi:NAD(P)H-dependent FMN reductase
LNTFAVIAGSHRDTGKSHQVAARLAELVETALPHAKANLVSIGELPFWDEGVWNKPELSAKWAAWRPVSNALKQADGLIVVSPEYHGMVPSRLMNFLLLCSAEEVGHKPALAVGVSATRGGAYPITQLRSYGYKNNRICWIPEHLILRGVDGKSDPIPEESPQGALALYCLRLLDAYASALKSVRDSGVVDHKSFPFGM